jgi:transmembrane sensor
MTEFDGNEELTPLERDAHNWVRRLTSGEATVADGEALKRWCNLSPKHAAAFASASQLWLALGPAGQSLLEGERVAVAQHFGRPQFSRRALFAGAVAASGAALLVFRPPLGLWPSLSELRADYRTGVGEQRQLVATDGISIKMNTRTSLSFVDKAKREVELISGEASFTTPAGAASPVAVVAAGGRVAALKGRFNVRLRGAGACVTCLSDQVQVDYRGRSVTLWPRQQVSYGGDTLGAVVTVDPTAVLAWQQGLMIFSMTPLSDVIQELNRYRTGYIVLLNASLAQSPVNGRFRIDRPDEALMQIEQAFGVRGRVLPGGFVLLG